MINDSSIDFDRETETENMEKYYSDIMLTWFMTGPQVVAAQKL